MSGDYKVNATAERIREIRTREGVDAARVELDTILTAVAGEPDGPLRTAGLDFNARLVTALRERGVRLWADAV